MIHGALMLDKPTGLSSSNALEPLREMLVRGKAKGGGRKPKVGHAGTLDPFATGALLALLGDATRLSNLAMGLAKTYRARVFFGRTTDTLDPEGRVVEEVDPGVAPPSGLAAAVEAFRGEIEQVPPAYSALKVKGRRAYRLARAGEEVELAARLVRIDSIRVVEEVWPEVEFEVVCGAGTYLRALARDLGAALGLPASLVGLRRTAIGPFAADAGTAPDAVDFERRIPPLALVEAVGLPLHVLDAAAALRFVTGRPVSGPFNGTCGLVLEERGGERTLIGLGEGSDDGLIHPGSVMGCARESIEQESARATPPRADRET